MFIDCYKIPQKVVDNRNKVAYDNSMKTNIGSQGGDFIMAKEDKKED